MRAWCARAPGSASRRGRAPGGPWKAEVRNVVPPLPERDPGEPPDVAGFVARLEPAPSEEVADRVDRPGDVVEQEDAHSPSPDQAADEAVPAAHERPGDESGDQERRQDDRQAEPGDDAEPLFLDQVRGVALPVGASGRLEQPADVRVPQPPQSTGDPGAEADVRALRITVTIRY